MGADVAQIEARSRSVTPGAPTTSRPPPTRRSERCADVVRHEVVLHEIVRPDCDGRRTDIEARARALAHLESTVKG